MYNKSNITTQYSNFLKVLKTLSIHLHTFEHHAHLFSNLKIWKKLGERWGTRISAAPSSATLSTSFHILLPKMLSTRQSYHVNLVKCRSKVCLVWGCALILLQMMKSYHLMEGFHLVKHSTQLNLSEIKKNIGTQISANLMMYTFSILFLAYGVVGLASEWLKWTLF